MISKVSCFLRALACNIMGMNCETVISFEERFVGDSCDKVILTGPVMKPLSRASVFIRGGVNYTYAGLHLNRRES